VTLPERLRHAIATEGPIRFDEYMRMALLDPEDGFYGRGTRLGAGGAGPPGGRERARPPAVGARAGARPGARGDVATSYIKRLEALEQIATSFEGVERAFAIQAGREIRVIVNPEQLDDLGAARLTRSIVKRIEDELEYPGQIKVMVVREMRVVEYAKR